MTKTNWQCTEHIVIMVMVVVIIMLTMFLIVKEIWVDGWVKMEYIKRRYKIEILDDGYTTLLLSIQIIIIDSHQDRKHVMSR